MSISGNKQFDAIDQLIFNEGLRIYVLDIRPEIDVMTIILNTRAVLVQKISDYPLLKSADKSQLSKYELISGGIGVRWRELDEDLSLRGFLQKELRKVVKGENDPIAA